MGIYIHYPFCYQKCDYCDFYSEGIGPGKSDIEQELFDTYKKEFFLRLENSADLRDRKIDTIFMGGGTPSKASAENWNNLLSFFKKELNVTEDVEISLEANPEDLSSEFLIGLKQAGINRLNVGVQTRNHKDLHFLGRHYEKDKYEKIGEILSQSPIERVGIDLMYGMPDSNEDDFWKDLEYFTNLQLKHISLYSLTLEKGTAYSRNVKDKKTKAPNEEMQREILELLPRKMQDLGYIWYEVSNYCKENEFSRHNLKYWTYEPYLGLGPGAHGFLDNKRYGNPRNSSAYLKKPGAAVSEPVSPREEIALSLFRLFLPISLPSYLDAFLQKDKEQILKIISRFKERDLCEWDGNTFQWKQNALFLLDDLILELVSES